MRYSSECTVLFRRTYRIETSLTALTLLKKDGCPFYTLLASTRNKDGICCARVIRLTTDEKFAVFLIEKCREKKISACHLTDVLEDNYDRFFDEYQKSGVPCPAILSE